MTTRYRVEYALKSHRRDEFIEWMKGLLAGPFVLSAGPVRQLRIGDDSRSSAETRRRYAEIFFEVERLIEGHMRVCAAKEAAEGADSPGDGAKYTKSRLSQLVPSVGNFFTKLPLERAFYVQDEKRSISRRRLVAPSFNDIRQILNTAQAMSISAGRYTVKLITFDGDVTLYDDGMSLEPDNPVIGELLSLLKRDIIVGIVTAAGYAERSGEKYRARLHGLIDAILDSAELSQAQKRNLLIMGGESNFLFRLNPDTKQLDWIEPEKWMHSEQSTWSEEDMQHLLDVAESTLNLLCKMMTLPGQIIRKERAVGIVPLPGSVICREELEELVLNVQFKLDSTSVGRKIEFCAFNGGSDVWVDIGDKRLGVCNLQKYLGGIRPNETLHVGDQFASLGANDFKARQAACTVWIASPRETVEIIRELILYLDDAIMD